jgi:hypothetical protein
MTVYEIVKLVHSSGTKEERTGLIYYDKDEAEGESISLQEFYSDSFESAKYVVREIDIIRKKRRSTVYIDMDDTAVNFTKQLNLYRDKYPGYEYPQSVIGFFSTMEPMPGFMDAWNKLGKHYDLAFCTRPSMWNINSYTENAIWVRDFMGGLEALEDLNLVPKKQRIGEVGDFLIDDWDIHGQLDFRGEFIHFGSQEGCMNWEEVTKYLIDDKR